MSDRNDGELLPLQSKCILFFLDNDQLSAIQQEMWKLSPADKALRKLAILSSVMPCLTTHFPMLCICKSRNFTDRTCHDPFDKTNAALVETCKVAMGSTRIMVPANYCIKVVGTSGKCARSLRNFWRRGAIEADGWRVRHNTSSHDSQAARFAGCSSKRG